MVENIISQTMHNKCRACLRTDLLECHSLYDDSLIEKFTFCTSIQISDDDCLPSKLCQSCYKLLLSFYSFKETCIHSQEELKKDFLTSLSNNKKFDENIKANNSVDADATFPIKRVRYKKKNENEEDIQKKFECNACHNIFYHKTALINHIKTHKAKSEKKYFRCPKCIHWFYTQERLLGHLRIHDGKKPAECSVCGKDFKKWSGLKQHMVQHEGIKRYVCEVCGKSFFFDWALRAHEKSHTVEDESFLAICDVCGKSFTSLGNLKIHLHVHSDERKFTCTQCNKKFKLEGSLKEHLLRHSGVKNHICPICGKRFSTRSEMRRHTPLHSDLKPFRCSHCDKQFKRKPLLANHMKVHSNEVHKCGYCNKFFSSALLLSEHRHSSEKYFTCLHCEKTFIKKNVLKNHTKICSASHDTSKKA